MSAAAHTPGPWRIAPASHYVGSELNVDAGENGTAGFICSPGQRDDPEAWANARMIAAAPEMLAALKWAEAALAPFSKEPAEKSGINMMRAAIAKAEGQS